MCSSIQPKQQLQQFKKILPSLKLEGRFREGTLDQTWQCKDVTPTYTFSNPSQWVWETVLDHRHYISASLVQGMHPTSCTFTRAHKFKFFTKISFIDKNNHQSILLMTRYIQAEYYSNQGQEVERRFQLSFCLTSEQR